MCFAKAGAVSRAGQIAALENTIYYPAMMTAHATAFILLAFVALPTFGAAGPLSWPINCRVGENCQLGLPDIDGDGKAADCRRAGYRGHEGTDIGISPAQMSAGMDVYAAADGVVQWVFDGKFDGCPSKHPDCGRPGTPAPGANSGYMVCTSSGPWCRDGKGACYWCFAGGNVVVIRHFGIPGVFATRYDHFRTGSITVKPGQRVSRGQVLGKVGSAGRSSGPHLHFEVWGSTWYDPVDPWSGVCSPRRGASLWQRPEAPWIR